MKKSEIKISYEADKLSAVKQYMDKKDVDMVQELEDTIGKLYEKYVPAPVREYIDFNAQNESETPAKPKKTATNAVSTETSNNRPATSNGIGSNQ